MFKRLSKANALRQELDDSGDEGVVSLTTVIDENSDSDPADDSNNDLDESEEDESEKSDESDADDTEFSVKQAMKSPIYIDDEMSSKIEIFRCVACPLVTLKNEKSIDVHLESKNHKRRFSRFIAFAESEVEREGKKVMQLDPRTLVDLLEDQRRESEKTEKNTGKVSGCGANISESNPMRAMYRGWNAEKCEELFVEKSVPICKSPMNDTGFMVARLGAHVQPFPTHKF